MLLSILATFIFAQNALGQSVGCGQQHSNNQPNVTGRVRIVGGSVAKPHSWPWLVLLNMDVTDTDGNAALSTCGSDLIRVKDGVEKSDILVTAAHCVTRRGMKLRYPPDVITARGGAHRKQQTETGEQVSKAVDIKVHENWDPKSANNDIALIKLAKSLEFSNTVRPICLPESTEDVPIGKQCVAAGWGLTIDGSGQFKTAQTLLQLRAPAHPPSKCQGPWKLTDFEMKHTICAGPTDASADTCPGDSGGMLACKNGDSWTLYGVTSFGNDCDKLEKDKPGVYTRVSAYSDWITKNAAKLTAL